MKPITLGTNNAKKVIITKANAIRRLQKVKKFPTQRKNQKHTELI